MAWHIPLRRAALELVHVQELFHGCLDAILDLWSDLLLLHDFLEDVGTSILEVLQPQGLKAQDLLRGHLVKVAARSCPKRDDDLSRGHRHELLLLQKLCQDAASQQLVLCSCIQIGAELRKGSYLTVLRQLQLQGASHLLHGLDLRSTADTAHRQTHVHSGADTLVEKLGLQEDLTIRNGDDVGGDVSTHVARLGLNHRQGGEGAATLGCLVHLGSTFQQPRVQVEHITWVGLTPWRPAQQKRHLAISHGLLGEIVVEDDRMLSVVAEVLCHGATRVRCQELQRCGIRSSCSHDRGVLQAVILSQNFEELGHSGSLLSYCDVDAVQVGRLVSRGIDSLLVEDCVDGNRGLASLAIADDQLSLATADWDQAVDSFQAGGHGLVHALPGNDARSLELHSAAALCLDGPGAINGRAKSIHNAAQQFLADRNIHNGSGALDTVTFDNGSVIAENHHSDVVGFQVQRHAL
mmetsp:Transcript_20831/g.49387  ORF Transcript_20831/g.49387 Transcript_20831/m.49387 type:complete len:465 (-) Transcript_20831:338-1732(-)